MVSQETRPSGSGPHHPLSAKAMMAASPWNDDYYRAAMLHELLSRATDILEELNDMLAEVEEFNRHGSSPPLTPDDEPEILASVLIRIGMRRLIERMIGRSILARQSIGPANSTACREIRKATQAEDANDRR